MTSVTIRSIPPKAIESSRAAKCLRFARPENMMPYASPVSVSIRLVWPYRKSEKPRVIANGIEVPMGSHPSLYLICQTLMDALVDAKYISDVNLITTLRIIKRLGQSGLWKVDIQPDGEVQRLF